MKKSIFIAMLLCAYTSALKAQKGGYQAAMTTHLQKLDTATTRESFVELTNSFERIASKEKSLWLPYYYAAFAKLNEAYLEKNKDNIDGLCDQATVFLDQAEALSPKNSEIYCVKAMLATARIKVDFMERGPKYVTLANSLLQEARALNADNPRVYFLLAQNLYGTPKGLGGGKEKALPLFEKSESLFSQQIDKEKAIEPHWGRGSAEKILQKYKDSAQVTTPETKSN